MSKGWVAVAVVLILTLGSVLLIKSANAVCGREFMHVSICGYVPDIET